MTSPRKPHAIKRAKERFGIDLTTSDLKEISRMIQDGKSVLVSNCRNNSEKHIVLWNEIKMGVIYCRDGYILTVLDKLNSREWPEQYRPKVKKQWTRGKSETRREKNKLRRIFKGALA